MSRCGYSKRPTCESCRFIDVREWHRQGLLRFNGLRFACSWTRGGEALGSIEVRSEADAVILTIKTGWAAVFDGPKSVEQRVPIVWTRCHFGGARVWFQCPGDVGEGLCCGRRVARLYLR